MEFKLNKVEPEVRQRVNDMTKSGKVHSKTSIIINENKKQKKEEHKFEEELEKFKGKKLEVEAAITETSGKEAAEEDRLIGRILDTRK